MAVTASSSAPTLEDAAKAAAILADEGASRVLVYGSVAVGVKLAARPPARQGAQFGKRR